MASHIAMVLLMHGVILEKIGTGHEGRGGPFGGPSDCCTVITRDPQRAFADVVAVGKDVLVGNDACQLQVRDGQGATTVVRRYQSSRNVR